jgi:hypothetical protein
MMKSLSMVDCGKREGKCRHIGGVIDDLLAGSAVAPKPPKANRQGTDAEELAYQEFLAKHPRLPGMDN